MRTGGNSGEFFVSYTHADFSYVERLVHHLRSKDIPAWFDADMTVGSRWVTDTARRIQQAVGVIVVMSPAAAESEWVEREILESQRRERQIMPLLLQGERLFLLASIQYFDARGGQLPDERVIEQMRRLCIAGSNGDAHGPMLVMPPPTVPRRATAAPSTVWSLDALRDALADTEPEGRIERADILTTSLILDAARRADAGWLRRSDAMRLPRELMLGIDQIWSEFSDGKFGLRQQLERHRVAPAGALAGRARDFLALAMALGWRADTTTVSPRYGSFVLREHGPGFFPTLRNPQLERGLDWYDRWLVTVMAVHLQLRQWDGRT